MKRHLTGFLLTLATFGCPAQPNGWSVQGPVDVYTTDELGNLYVLKGNELFLYDRQGQRMAQNSLTLLGPISSIDASASLKPMVFARDQGQLAVLDNTLSLLGGAITLARHGSPWVGLACAGVQSRYWFYDERDMAVVHVEKDLAPIATSGRLDQLLGFAPQPTALVEANGRVYLVDPAQGVLVFDLFATYLRTLPIQGARQIQVRDNLIWCVAQGRLYRYDLRTFTQEEVPWPPDGTTAPVLDARLDGGRLYRRTAEGLRVDVIGK
ncbi:MAG: hypothetical protein KBH07_10790 [Flavobacteriales bacterium]|nr:hypothetical protein [Flavobacteriales bacterium]MBP9081164.1 hypothetical protein [Flavobacteriales bacterium]